MIALKSPTIRVIIVAMAGCLFLIGVVLWLTRPTPVMALPGDLSNAEAKYSVIIGTRIDTCALCHTAAPALNTYGEAYINNGRNTAALTAIEALDSDGDGFSNLQEINALTFPGNAADHPSSSTSTNTPTRTATRTATGTATRTATPTMTGTATRTGTPTATRTNTATPTETIFPTTTPIGGPALPYKVFVPSVKTHP